MNDQSLGRRGLDAPRPNCGAATASDGRGGRRVTQAAAAVPLFVRPDWYDDALCAGVGPDLFYAERGVSTAPAVAICQACPVQVECLQFAAERDEAFGIWGGATPRQRVMVRRSSGLTRRGRYVVGPRPRYPQADNKMETTSVVTLDEWPS